MKQRRRSRRMAVWLLAFLFAAATAPAGLPAQEALSYRLKWLVNISTAGDVFAVEQGWFAREALDVEVKAGGPERDAIRELELGYAQFGVASADQVIRALSKGASVVVLAQLFQVNPLQWIYRADDFTLERIQDLAGRKVGVTYGGNDETILRALLAVSGMAEDRVRLVSVRYDFTPFLRRQVEVWPVYRNTQGILLADQLAAANERVAFFDPSAHGVNFVANSLVTSQRMVDERPQTVERFTRALLAGWQAAMRPDNEEAVIRAVSRHDRDTPPTAMQRQLGATRRMVQPDPGVPVGHIDVDAWRQTEAIMLQQRLIAVPVKVTERLAPPSLDGAVGPSGTPAAGVDEGGRYAGGSAYSG